MAENCYPKEDARRELAQDSQQGRHYVIFCWLWAKVFGCSCYGKMVVDGGNRPCIGNRGRKKRGKAGERACFAAIAKMCQSGSHQPASPDAAFRNTHLPGF